MFTRCPNCGTVFNISDQQLTIANGSVRCGACEIIFDARLSLFAKIEYPPKKDADVDVTAEADIISPAQQSSESGEQQETLLDPVNTPAQVNVPDEISDQISELEAKSNSSALRKVAGSIILLTLCALFALQTIAHYKAELLPLAVHTETCKWLKCSLTPATAIEQIEILNRDIISHPDTENALLVTMTIINRAKFAQAYPLIELRLFDVVGDVIAARRFTPAEYLPFSYQPEDKFIPATPIAVRINLVDPGEQVVGYELNFR
jgi:predicted Zn finger-like uncharacterized protein